MITRILVAALVVLPSALRGQGLSVQSPAASHFDLSNGRRLRITLVGQQDASLVGTLLGSRGDTLYLRRAGEPDTLVAQSSISRVDFSDGRHGHALAGLLIGGAAGAGLGAATVAHGWEAAGAIVYGAGGLLAGGIVGALIRTERWTPITPTIVTGRTASGRSTRTVAVGVRLAM